MIWEQNCREVEKIIRMVYNVLNKRTAGQRTPGRRNSVSEIAPTFPEQGRYFLCIKIVITRVITEHIIVIQLNKSLYATIAPSLLSFDRRLGSFFSLFKARDE